MASGSPPLVGNFPTGISWQKLTCDLWLIGKMVTLLRNRNYGVVHTVKEAIFLKAALAGKRGTILAYDMDSSLSEKLVGECLLLRPLRRPLLFYQDRHLL